MSKEKVQREDRFLVPRVVEEGGGGSSGEQEKLPAREGI